jgi:hypothetical protein
VKDVPKQKAGEKHRDNAAKNLIARQLKPAKKRRLNGGNSEIGISIPFSSQLLKIGYFAIIADGKFLSADDADF